MGFWTRTERRFRGIARPHLYGNSKGWLENRHSLTKHITKLGPC
jgi:hypothetical protein